MITGILLSRFINTYIFRILNLLRKIMLISFDIELNEIKVNYLERIIAEFIREWDAIYEKGVPKLHYLVHLPNVFRK